MSLVNFYIEDSVLLEAILCFACYSPIAVLYYYTSLFSLDNRSQSPATIIRIRFARNGKVGLSNFYLSKLGN